MMFPWLDGSVTWLLTTTLKATLLIGMAGAMCAALRGCAPRFRHTIWNIALVGALLIPILTQLTPTKQIRLPQILTAASPSSRAAITPDPATNARAIPKASYNVPEQLVVASGPGTSPFTHVTTWLTSLHWKTWFVIVWFSGGVLVLCSLLVGLSRARWGATCVPG